MKDKLGPVDNIKVVDFSKIELGETDFTFPFIEEKITISEVLKYRYNDIHPSRRRDNFSKRIHFGVILDAMRLVMLQNIQQITGKQEAIYMDFDIFPDKNGKNLNEIKIPKGILMADGKQNDSACVCSWENSIIAINKLAQPILLEIICHLQKKFDFCITPDDINNIDQDTVLGSMESILNLMVTSEYSKKPKEELITTNNKNNVYSELQEQSAELKKLYTFQNSCLYVQQTQDNSWKKTNLYDTDELQLEFDSSPSSDMNNSNIESKNQSEIKF